MKRLCAEPGCSAAVNGKRCPKHVRTGWQKTDERRPASSARGYGAAWKTIREGVLLEQPICRCPGYARCRHEPGKCGRRSTEVDHIVRRRAGGSDDRSNLQGLCGPCHIQKTHVEVNEQRKANAAARAEGGST